jgi:energy-coupling factor transport system permease protein
LVRLPIDEWAVALALALRAFPMLIDEFQVLYAARRLRPKPVPRNRKEKRQQRRLEVIDLLAATITVTLRRADEMGDAITARGGTGQLSAHPRRPKLSDWVAMTISVLVCGAGVAIQTMLTVR